MKGGKNGESVTHPGQHLASDPRARKERKGGKGGKGQRKKK